MNDLIHILDKKTDEIIGTISAKNGDYWTDERTDSLTNENTFDFTMNATKETSVLLQKRNRLVLQDEDGFFREYIIFYAEQYNRRQKNIRANASWQDLNKAKVIEPQTLQGATAYTATETALNGTEWSPGNIDYAGIVTLKIEEYTNPLDLIKRIASEFDLEISYRVEVAGNKITKRYVDLKVKTAGFEGKEIVFGKDLLTVRRKEDSSMILTALTGLGPVKEDGTRLTVTVYDEEAKTRWGRNGLDLIQTYEPQSDDTEMSLERLTTLTRNELNKRIDSIVSYECEAAAIEEVPGLSHEKIRVARTIRIKDDGYQPPLYLEARIEEVKRQQSNGRIKSFKIGNFLEFSKAELEKQIADLKSALNDKARKMITSYISSTKGAVLKDNADSTVLKAVVFNAGVEVDPSGTLLNYSYTWEKFDKAGVKVSGYSASTKSITVTGADVDEKATYKCTINTGIANINSEYAIDKGSQGPPGDKGDPGDPGPQGIPGPPGEDGTSKFTWVKYATSSAGANMSDLPDGKTYIGFAYNKDTATESNTATDYTWALIQGPQGTPGEDGTTKYTWLKYANDANGTGMSDLPTGKTYMGIAYNKDTATESATASDYSWSLIKGDKGDKGDTGATGPQGVPGEPGKDGTQYWTWVKYADSPTTGMSDTPTGKKYIGIAVNKTSSTESAVYGDYTWSLIEGPQGVPGTPGEDGVTTYTWIKYADDANGAGLSDSPTGKRFLGLAHNKTTATESTTASDYLWSPLYDNVEIGGVNMLPHTDFANDDMVYWRAYNLNSQAGDKTDITLDSGEIITFMRVRSVTGLAAAAPFGVSSGLNTISEEKMSFIAGEKYTISFLVAAHGNATQNLSYTFLLNDGGSNQSLSMPYVNTMKVYGHMTTPFSLNVYQYSFTFTARDTWDRTRLLLGARTSYDMTGTNSVGLFYVSRLQIEKGNVASGWSAKPTDNITYTWTVYGDDSAGANLSTDPAGKFWKGTAYNKKTPTPSTTASDYKWEFITNNWVKSGTVKMDGGNIYADSLSTITANIGKVTTGEIEGVTMRLGLNNNGDLQVWGDMDGDGTQEITGRVDNTGIYTPALVADSIHGDVINKYTGVTKTVYFDTAAGDDAKSGVSWSYAKKNIKAYINELPKNLNGQTITLYFRGDITGGFSLEGFHNGQLQVSGDTSTTRYKVYGYANINYCTDGKFLLQGFDVVYDATATPDFTLCSAVHSDYAMFYSVKAYGNGGGKFGFWAEHSNMKLGECHVYNVTDRGLYAYDLSKVYVENCRGAGVVALLAGPGSEITGTGTRWSGSLVRWSNGIIGATNAANTGWTLDLWTVDTAEGTPTQPAPPAKKTIAISASTGDNYSSSGYWTNDEVKQGNAGWGSRYGLWYFDFSAIKGKTVHSATITMYRNPGAGTAAARTAYLRSHSYTSRANRPASMTSANYSGANAVNVSINTGQTVTVDITNMVNLNIAGGTGQGIGVFNTGSTDYMSLGITPTVVVTYS